MASRPDRARRILVVDDDASIREVTRMTLEMVGGHEVLTAGCGRDALAQAVRERPDAILLDVMMPGLDGPATFERLQADPSTADIPVILLTAKLQATDQARFVALGVRAVLSKPFDPMKLPGEVAGLLGWREATDGG
jgi:two-component system alkaline phosphatase synthesis response regulator PhoP